MKFIFYLKKIFAKDSIINFFVKFNISNFFWSLWIIFVKIVWDLIIYLYNFLFINLRWGEKFRVHFLLKIILLFFILIATIIFDCCFWLIKVFFYFIILSLLSISRPKNIICNYFFKFTLSLISFFDLCK